MPHQLREIQPDDSVHSLDSHGNINTSNSVPSYADQQLAHERAEEEAAEAEKKAKRAAHETSEAAQDFGRKAEGKAQELKKDAQGKYKEAKKEAGVEGEKAKKKAKEAEDWADKNKGNPVVLGNAVAVAALGGLLGFGAYRKYNAGELTWKVASAWAGVVGLFAAGDYFVSQYVLQDSICAVFDEGEVLTMLADGFSRTSTRRRTERRVDACDRLRGCF